MKRPVNKKIMNMKKINAPEASKPEKNSENFYDNVQKIVDREVKKSGQLILLRDFNFRIEEVVMPGIY